jgi:L-rhamnose mutarotase
MSTILSQISAIDEKIAELQTQRNELAMQLNSEASTFTERVSAWQTRTDKEHLRYIPSEREYPKLRKYMDECLDVSRHQTVDIEEYLEDEIYMIINPENLEEYRTYSPKEIVREMLEEVIKHGIGSFTIDW